MSYDPSQFEQGDSFGQAQPQKKKSALPMVFIVLGGLGLLAVVACCGGGIWMANFGMSIVSAEIANQLEDHPQIQEHVGDIVSLDVDWAKSMAEEGDDVFVFDLEGSKASGELIVNTVTNEAGDEEIMDATLKLESGEKIPLELDSLPE